MSNSPQYEAFREFARATIALEVIRATQPLHEEIRSLRAQIETRSALIGPSGSPQYEAFREFFRAAIAPKDGAPGADGRDGRDGKDGRDGERGTDGIGTIAELDARLEARFAEVQVRTFADVYQGVFKLDKVYSRGQLATWDGSLWLSLNETRSKPGENNDWKLIAKRGADGRK